MTHHPLPYDTRIDASFVTGKTQFFRRIPCECGWRGDWCEDCDSAERSYEQHAETPEENMSIPDSCACVLKCSTHEAAGELLAEWRNWARIFGNALLDVLQGDYSEIDRLAREVEFEFGTAEDYGAIKSAAIAAAEGK